MNKPPKISQFEVWIADLNSPNGTEPGKVRPVVIVQTNLLNGFHPSTLICPVTTNIFPKAEILRVNLSKNEAGLKQRSSVLVDQVRAIDNKRLVKRLGALSKANREKLRSNLKTVMEL